MKTFLKIFFAVTIFTVVAGCATMSPEAKARMLYDKGDYAAARAIYMKKYYDQRTRATIPFWSGKKYSYDIRPRSVARNIDTIAGTYRAEENHQKALYWYLSAVQFCSRHQISNVDRIESIRAYIEEASPAIDTNVFSRYIQQK